MSERSRVPMASGGLPAAPTSLPEPTAHIHHHTIRRNGLLLGVCTITPARTSRPPMIMTLGILARLDPFEVQRFRLLADLLQRQIIALETPGWMRPGQRLPASARQALTHGDFTEMAELMVAALDEAVPGLTDQTVSLLGYSLGASTGSAIAATLAARGTTLERITLVEPVATGRQSLVGLGLRNTADGVRNRRYLKESKQVEWAARSTPVRMVRRGWVDLGLFTWALSRGGIQKSLNSIDTSVGVKIITGERSRMAGGRATEELVEQLRSTGRSVEWDTIADSHHGLWLSLPRVAEVARLLS
ncbi:hypothetical protein ACQBAR_12630 [Propionibacteriaceae bacterium Y1685]